MDPVSQYVKAVADKAAVPPGLITTILAFLMQFLAGCVPPPKPAQVREGGAWAEVLLKASIMKAGVRPRDPRFGPILDALRGVAATQKDEDVAAFLGSTE